MDALFFKIFPYTSSTLFFSEYKYIWASGLLHPNITCGSKRILWKWKIEQTIREKYKLEFAFYQYILPQDLHQRNSPKISTDMPEGMYYHAIYHQYRGDLLKARLYSQSLKGMNTKTFDNIAQSLLYHCLTKRLHHRVKKNITKLIYERLSSIRNDACLTFLHPCPLNEKMESAIEHILYNYIQIFTIVKVLIVA